MAVKDSMVPVERIERSILLIRGQKVMLDADLAALYGVSVGRLNEAVKRNAERFPADFMFKLTKTEYENLISQFATSNLKSQIAISSWGGRRHNPFVFTEQGVAMLSSVLKSKRAVQVNIEIMRAFVKLRQLIASHADLEAKLTALESKYDKQFKIVFEAIRQLMAPPKKKGNPIGFKASKN